MNPSNAFVAAAESGPVSNKRHRCKTGLAFIEANEEGKRALTEILASPHWTYQAIADLLTSNGYRVDHSGVWRHKNRRCSCQPGQGR